MVQYTGSSGVYAVPDVEAAAGFYRDVLGVQVDEQEGMLQLTLPGGWSLLVYPKPDHRPAVFTVLNLFVDDLPAAIDELAAKGAEFVRYPGFEQDERGIASGMGPDIAWTTDPAGNIIAIIEGPED